jgi:DNA-binding transcriptional MocR family regulator
MPRANIAPDLGLPIALDRASQIPIHQQLCEQLRRAILDGRLSRGARLPSTRILARALGVSRTVTPLDAYYFGAPDRPGLLLGYGSLEIPDIIRGATALAEVIEQVAALSFHS